MFDREKIIEIAEKSREENWPYPKIFNALRDAGVEYYETIVPEHKITYYGRGGSWTEPPPEGFAGFEASDTFDAAGVKDAILRAQRKEIDYTGFLRGIAAAGVKNYRVDMGTREIAYKGGLGEQYVEKVPDFRG